MLLVCLQADGWHVFKSQHLVRERSDVSGYHSPGEGKNKYQEVGWRQVGALGKVYILQPEEEIQETR